MFIETATGKPLFKIDESLNSGQPGDAQAEWVTATRIVDSGILMKEIGAKYSDIVSRCIWCRFDGISDYDLTRKDMQVSDD